MNTKLKGYALGSIAAITYGMNPLLTIPLYMDGMSPGSVLFFRYLFAVPILAAMMCLRGRSFRVTTKEWMLAGAFGLLFAFSSLTLFLSYRYMDAGIASTLLFVYPLIVALIMVFFFKEKMSAVMILCLLMATGGIALLYKDGAGVTLSAVGTLLVMASSLSYAVYIVGVNQTILKNMPTLTIIFYVSLFGWLLFVVYNFTEGKGIQIPSSESWYLWLNLFALGLLPTAVSLICMTTAIRYIGSTPAAILGALEPLTAIFFGVTIFNEKIDGREAVGVVLILLSVSIVVAADNISSYMLRLKKMFARLPRKRKE